MNDMKIITKRRINLAILALLRMALIALVVIAMLAVIAMLNGESEQFLLIMILLVVCEINYKLDKGE